MVVLCGNENMSLSCLRAFGMGYFIQLMPFGTRDPTIRPSCNPSLPTNNFSDDAKQLQRCNL
jgi:hypothetical protein